MRIAYFQPFSGASGDMALGALVDAGAPLDRLEEGLRTLAVEGWRIEARKEMRGALMTTRLKVLLESGAKSYPPAREPTLDEEVAHHHHEHPHGHHHGSPHPHHGPSHASPPLAPPRGHHHDHAHPPERRLGDLRKLIGDSGLPQAVKTSATAVFERLGAAEARVHGIGIEEVGFHEVGAVDSIIDIVGTCLALHLLGIEEVHSAPVTVGTGFVLAAHGKLPLPAPATLELLRGHPVEQRDSRAELTTPTGAALLTTLAKGFGTMPPLVISAVGYGAGDDRPDPVPNALRVIVGERAADTGMREAPSERVLVLEASIDDMSPQWFGNLMEKLFEAGALDVSFTSIIMKKSRPGQEVKVIAPIASEHLIVRTLFAESTTFGVRRSEMDRVVLAREFHPVETPWGAVRVKVGSLGGEALTASPEFEDLRKAAAKAGLPLREVHQRVMELFRKA